LEPSARCPVHKNWSGNVQYQTNEILYPTNVEKLREIVMRSAKLHVFGSGHSFSNIAEGEVMISLTKMKSVVYNSLTKEVTIGGGVTYSDLIYFLSEHGRALQNLASLPHLNVAGAVSTGTHGSGDKIGNLANQVIALDYLLSNGSLITLHREHNSQLFQGAVVNLGALGIITSLTLATVEHYYLKQCVYSNLSWPYFRDNLDEIISSSYSISFFF